MLRSVFSARVSAFVPARALSTHAVQQPKTPVNLGHLADNAGAISEVRFRFLNIWKVLKLKFSFLEAYACRSWSWLW